MLCIYFLKVFYVYLSKIYTETAEISKKEDCEFCAWASHFIMNYKVMLCIYFLQVFYVYLSKIYTETAEISKKKKTVNFVRGRRTLLWITI